MKQSTLHMIIGSALVLWFFGTCLSLLSYAFLDKTPWTPLAGDRDILRFLILLVVHVAGIVIPLVAASDIKKT